MSREEFDVLRWMPGLDHVHTAYATGYLCCAGTCYALDMLQLLQRCMLVHVESA